MIHESRYWKVPLVRSATLLEKVRVDEESPEAALARVEREVFIGFYAIRKLLETFKLSQATKRFTVDLQCFAALPEVRVDYFNKYNIDEHYDLGRPASERRDLGFICNQIIHSYVFVIGIAEDRSIEGFFVTSDSMRHRKLYFLPLANVVAIFRLVGRDYPKEQRLVRNRDDQWVEAGDAS